MAENATAEACEEGTFLPKQEHSKNRANYSQTDNAKRSLGKGENREGERTGEPERGTNVPVMTKNSMGES